MTIVISEEIKQALQEKKALVALESTIITHGMPYPQNIETAKSVESVVREEGAIPATIALMEGKVCVGLDDDDLEKLALNSPAKASLRDLPFLMAKKQYAGTTVASTSFLAKKVGIDFFATGGIGGVHRGAAESFDISNDLVALSKISVCVVSSGIKSILDIPKTLELLETLGVMVGSYQNKFVPAFYSSDSPYLSPYSFESVDDVVSVLQKRKELNLKSALLLMNSVPREFEIPFAVMEEKIQEAIKESKRQGITGQGVTPYLLKAVKEITKGESLKTNIALIKNNAKLAAQLTKNQKII